MVEGRVSRLRRFLSALRDGATRNVPLKALALVMAFGLWAFVNFGERDTEEALKVPVQFRNIPARLMITSPRVDFVDVRVVGPRTLLGRIDHNQLAIPLDFSGARPGPAFFTVNVDRLNLPRGVRVVRVTPAQVTVTLERVRRKIVPVQLRIDGDPPEDFRVVATSVVPEQIEISGPESLVVPVERVSTDPLVLDETARATIRQELPIEPLGEYVTPRPGSVQAIVEIEELQIERILDDVPIAVMGNPDLEHAIAPSTARVTLRGPRRVVDVITADGLASVDAIDLEPGVHVVEVIVTAPEEVAVVAVEPDAATLTIAAPTPTPVPMSVDTVGATPLERPLSAPTRENP